MSTLIKLWEEKDWDSIIAEVEKSRNDYFYSAFAKLFLRSKEHNENNYKDVIEDASKALIAPATATATAPASASATAPATAPATADNARRIRAFAYYLSGNYERAIFDCEKLGKKDVFANELRGMIALSVDDYGKVITNCTQLKEALKEVSVEDKLLKSASSLDACIKTYKKIK